MKKKVLILSGSPRKGGNVDLLCDEFLKGAIEAGHQAEKVFIGDKELNFCTACYGCRSTGNCVTKDDMSEILEKMIESDVIVLSSPVYFYSVDAQMKMVIDRTVAKYAEIKNKEFYFIATAAVGDKQKLERTMECFRGFTDCLTEASEKGTIYATGVWQKGEVEGTPFMAEAYNYGRNL